MAFPPIWSRTLQAQNGGSIPAGQAVRKGIQSANRRGRRRHSAPFRPSSLPYGCAFRTETGLTRADQAQMAAIMASGSASAQAERTAIGRTEAWFERRIAPLTGTATRVARAGPLIGLAGNRGQFDCIDTTNNTNSLLLVLNQLTFLRPHTIAAPVSRFLFTQGPHNTAVHQDRQTNELWTVDPWTHKGSEVPDIFPLAKVKAGD